MGSAKPDEVGGDALCFAMIETREGIENLEEIAATPGLDGLYIGPSDLSIALGLAPGAVVSDPSRDRPALAEAIERIRKACDANGLIAGMHCGSGDMASQYARDGFRLITVGVDTSLFKATIGRELSAARAV
jgi:4-hydroxy-2-oxoheptanedioate aldolase